MEMKTLKNRWKGIVTVLAVFAIVLIAWSLAPLAKPGKPSGSLKNKIPENPFYRKEITYYPMEGKVNNISKNETLLGLATQSYELNFGKVPENSTVGKIIVMNSSRPAKIRLTKFGNISEKIETRKSFWLRDYEKVRVDFESSSTGNFTGTLAVESMVPKNFIGKQIIKLI